MAWKVHTGCPHSHCGLGGPHWLFTSFRSSWFICLYIWSLQSSGLKRSCMLTMHPRSHCGLGGLLWLPTFSLWFGRSTLAVYEFSVIAVHLLIFLLIAVLVTWSTLQISLPIINTIKPNTIHITLPKASIIHNVF